MNLITELERFFSTQAPIQAGDGLLVAFSGGPDSTALLWGLRAVRRRLGFEIAAAHVDHALDPDSRRRAREARRLCESLGIELRVLPRSVTGDAVSGESRESAARRIRYAALEVERRRLGARYIATAHHHDDQIETVLLRVLYGSGLAGLAGVLPRQGRIVRPLLRQPRSELLRLVAETRLQPVDDPTNYDLRVPRNRLRHLLWPRLAALDPGLGDRLACLAEAAGDARAGLARRLRRELDLGWGPEGPDLCRRRLAALPAELWPFALSLLHRAAGVAYPPPNSARRDLERQLHHGDRVGCDCGGGWRWESRGERIRLCRSELPEPPFAYTVQVPGEYDLPALSLRFRLQQGPVAPWMFRPSSRRAGLALPLRPGDSVVIRSRRAGDRVRPFGCTNRRRLKDLLIDRGVPRRARSRLPLLQVGARLAWVPGVTIDDAFRVVQGDRAWIAELEPI